MKEVDLECEVCSDLIGHIFVMNTLFYNKVVCTSCREDELADEQSDEENDYDDEDDDEEEDDEEETDSYPKI